MSKWTDDYLDKMNANYGKTTYNKTKPEEPGFAESAWGNLKGGFEGAISGLANFAGANLRAAANNPLLNQWLSAKGLEAQGQAMSNTGYDGPNLYKPITENNPTPYEKSVQSIADSVLNEGAYLDTLAQDNMRKYGPRDTYGGFWDRATNWDYWTDPRGAIADISQGVGSSLPMIAASVAVPGSGIAARAGAEAMRGAELLSGITGRKLASEAIGKGFGGAVEQGVKWGLGGGSTEAVMDAGSIYSELKQQGLNDDEIASRINNLAISEAPYLMASDAITGGLITGRLGNVLKGNKYLGGDNWYKAAARTITTTLPLNMASEYATEMKQQQLQKEFTGKPYGTFFDPMPDEEQAGASGAMGALGFGAIGGARAGINRGINYFRNNGNTVNEPVIQENTNNDTSFVPSGVENADAWRAAQIAANDVGRPDLAKTIYAQWANESGRFSVTSGENNYGGLKDTNGNYRDYSSIEDFAHSYANDFLRHYDLSNVSGPRDFVHILKQNGYFESDEQQYANNVESIANEIGDTGGITLPDKKYYNVLGEVSDTGLTTLTEQKLNLLARDFYNRFGYNLDVTSMKRNGDGSSWHDSGQAIDIANDLLANDPQARAWLIEQGKKYGLTALDEYTNPSANATGGHIHFSDHGEPIPGVSSGNNAPIRNSASDNFYNNTDYSIDVPNAQNLQADNIELSSPAAAQDTQTIEQNAENLSEDEKWDILDNEIEKANNDGDVVYLDRLERIKRNNDTQSLNSVIQDLIKSDTTFLRRLRLNQADNFTPQQQAELDRLTAQREQLINENNTLEAMNVDEKIKNVRANFMMDNAFRGGNRPKNNTVSNNQPTFDSNTLRSVGNNMLQQMQQANIPTANYEALQTAINSNDVNRQRDAITAMQMQNNIYQNQPSAQNNALTEQMNNLLQRLNDPNYIPAQQTVNNASQTNMSPEDATATQETPDNSQSIQDMVDNLYSEFSTNLNDDYGGNKSSGRIRNIYDAIQNAQQYEDFVNSLSEDERLFMDFLDYTYTNTGKSFTDILEGLREDRKNDIDAYIEVLRNQMKLGVTKRSVAYNRETGEYKNLPGFSNNYQWYRDMMQFNNYRQMNKQDTENYLYDTALEHLRYGYIDPQYGEQVPQAVTVIFNDREDAINGLENIAEKAIRYENGRQLQSENKRRNANGDENIRQEQQKGEVDYETAKRLGQFLYNTIQEKQLKADLKSLDEAINSENTQKQQKAIDFMQRKLNNNLDADEKRELADNIQKLKQIKQSTTKNASGENTPAENNIEQNITENENGNNVERVEQPETKISESEEIYNELNDSTGELATRDSEGNNQNAVGTNDESGQSSRRGGQSVRASNEQRVQPRSSGSVYGRSPDTGGTAGDSAVRTEKPADTGSSTGDTDVSGSSANSSERQTNERNSTGTSTESVEKRPDNADKLNSFSKKQQKRIAYFTEDLKSTLNRMKINDTFSENEVIDIVSYIKDYVVNSEEYKTLIKNNTVGRKLEMPITDLINDGRKKFANEVHQVNRRKYNALFDFNSIFLLKGIVIPENIYKKFMEEENTALNKSITENYEQEIPEEQVAETVEQVESLFNEKELEQQRKPKVNNEDFKAGNLESIKKDLPYLLPEQQDDIVAAENRLLVNKKTGMMFTNGTGTGKTFTGLGIVKRFVNQGKDNILIIAPRGKIIADWRKSAKDFFGLNVKQLDGTSQNGDSGIVITTFANMGQNQSLVNRNWDLIIVDESHYLMSNEAGTPTKALIKLRELTFHNRAFYERTRDLHAKEYAELDKIRKQIKEDKENNEDVAELKQKAAELSAQLSDIQRENAAEWQEIKPEDKPKTVFLSATPFPWVKDIDYAEGYLFDYENLDSTAYNAPDGYSDFFIKNFGYSMRYNRLERPDADVDNSVMEIQFHEKLKKAGALSGRTLTVDKDYDRGFILVDGGIGTKIDKGFEYLRDSSDRFRDLTDYLYSHYDYFNRMYLLEAVKAHEAIDLINQYLQTGKKIVVFHNYKKGGSKHPFKLDTDQLKKDTVSYMRERIQRQYEVFAKERPDLINLNLNELQSPIETLTNAFGDRLALFNGSISERERQKNADKFNKDDSDTDIILVQSDAGKEGISLHDRTGKHQRVLINLGLPTKPAEAIQTEGRIYRVGQKSNAIFRYLNTGTDIEREAFASKIAQRASTVENLALGDEARSLKMSYVEAFQDTIDSDEWKKYLPGSKTEGTGGKAKDYANKNALTDFDRAKSYYFAQQKKTSKNKAAEGKDYFATPEPIGLKMVEWANLKDGEAVLEPSAGHGAIARWFPATTKNIAIEPSRQLASLTQMNFDGNVIEDTFENYNTINKFNAIVMNPPFGTGGKTAIDHVAKAFKHLRDGGRIVTIVPQGPSCQKHLDRWLDGEDGKNATVIKEIKLPGSTFSRAGTTVATRILVIDKQEYQAGKEAVNLNMTMPLDLSDAENINELFDRIENIQIPDRINPTEAQQAAYEQTQANKKQNNVADNTVEKDTVSDEVTDTTEDIMPAETAPDENTVPLSENISTEQKTVPTVETILANDKYLDEVVDSLKPYKEIKDLTKYTTEANEREQALNKINSNAFKVTWDNKTKLYTIKINHSLIYKLTVQYESKDIADRFKKLANKNNGSEYRVHYGYRGYSFGGGEFFSPFKNNALLEADYTFENLNNLRTFITDIGEIMNEFYNQKFIIREFPTGIYVYITNKAGLKSNAPIEKTAKDNGSDTNIWNDIILAGGNVYSFDTRKQAEQFINDLKKYTDDSYFKVDTVNENGKTQQKIAINKNFSFRNMLTDIDRHKKIKVIAKKHGGTYSGINNGNPRILYKNTDYFFDTKKQADDFMAELENIVARREYTDIEAMETDNDVDTADDINHDFELSDFKHTKTGEILKRAKPIRNFEDFAKLSKLAKENGGHYSRFKIGQQTAGFLFKTEQQRSDFLNAVADNFKTETTGSQTANNGKDIAIKYTAAKPYIALSRRDNGDTVMMIKVPLSNKHFTDEIQPVLLQKEKYHYTMEETAKSRVLGSGVNIVFKDKQNAKEAVEEIEQVISKNKKRYSGMGQMIPSIVTSDNFVPENRLTKEEKALRNFGKAIGCPVIFFDSRAAKNIRGAFSGGIIYLNRASNISPRWTFYHEFTHWLRYSNPDIYEEIRLAVGDVSADNINDYRKQIVGGKDEIDGRQLLSDEDIIEEMIADKMFNTSTRVQINRLMVQSNPSLWQRFVAFWKNILDRFRALYAIPAGLDRTQTKTMNEAMERLVTSIKDYDGKVLFKRTKDGLAFADTSEPVVNHPDYAVKPIAAQSYSASERPRLSSSQGNWFINKIKTKWQGKQSTSKPIQIKQALETLSGYTFESGRIEGSVQNVVINHVAKIIRTRKAFDYHAMLIGVAPVLAEKLGFKNDINMQNYIANYIFDVGSARQNTFMFNKLTAAINQKNMNSDFVKIQNLFDDLKSMSAREKFRNMRVNKDTVPNKGIKKWLYDTYMKQHDQWIDRYGPVQRMVEQFEKATGQKLQYANPYKQFRLVAGSAGLGMSFVEGKKGSVNEALQEIFPNIDFKNFKSLETILKDNKINDKRENMEVLADYAIAMYNRDNPESVQGIISDADLNSIINSTPENIKKAHRELMDYQQKLFEIMADTGLISRQQLREFATSRRNYVPMYKYFSENDELMFQQNPDNVESANRLIVNPIEGIIANTYKTMRIAAKNKAKISLTTLANSKDIAPYTKIERVANTGENTKTTFSVMINGKKQTYKASVEIVEMMRDLDMENLNGFRKLLYKISTLMRAVATFANPEFGFSNAIRDIVSAMYYSKYNVKPMDFVHGFGSFFKKDKYYWEYMASGAAQTAAVSMDRNYTQASLDKLYKNSWKSLEKYKNMPSKILNALQYLSEASEAGVRIGQYRAGLRAMRKDGSINRQDIAYETRDLMDFSRSGNAGRELNRYTMFANASIQGWSKFIRDTQRYGTKYGLMQLGIKFAKYGLLPTLFFFFLNKDDDRYKELPQWVKDTHWVLPVGNTILRIPKSLDPATVMISGITERALNYSYNKDKEAFNNTHSLLINQLPSLFSTALNPVVEVMTNYSFFREGKIVPAAKERDMPRMQYDEYTSGFSKILGKMFNISPMKIDYMLYSYTGNYGRIGTKALDATINPKEYSRTEGVTNLEDIIFLRRFLYTPYKNTRSLTQFYEDYNQQLALYNEYKDTGIKPEEFNERYYEKLKEAQKEMRDIKQKQQEIMDDTVHSADYRQSALDRVNQKRLQIARKALRYKP